MQKTMFIRILFCCLAILFLCSQEASAQRWKKKKKETLYARNKKKQVSPVYVGIGVKDATAQLHTVGTVRHEGLTVNNSLNTILAVDASGNVFWRDISNTLANAWFLNGNTITSSNFLGTTNNEDLRIRTNNTQRVVITSAGSVGIGVASPSAQLHTSGSVRFEGITNDNSQSRLLMLDNTGNLFWRDVTSLGSNSWQLNGNNATATSFMGTINAEDIRFRVNNVQRAVLTSSGSFGLGVAAPSAQLHTNGTVRFEGVANNNTLLRLALFDNSGNLFYRDLASLQSNFWSLTGNTGTNPAINFLGTTDNNRLVFRTNNTEKMTILSDGSVGIGLFNPSSPLHVFSPLTDNQLFLSGAAPSTRYFQGTDWLTSPYHARIGLATGNANYVATSSPGDFIVQAMDNSNLLFGAGVAGGNGLERMRINSIGYTGISTTTPSAKLHINCAPVSGQTNPSNFRLENLQSGTGNPLVIDANGYVYAGTGGATNAWNLTGNAGTNPSTNFLGTTDNNRLVFRTNNTEKMTILANGNVGINITNPLSPLEINNSIPDNHLIINGVGPSIIFLGNGLGPNDAGRIGFANLSNQFTQGSLPSDFILQTLGATANLIFGTGGGGTGNGIERARINSVGYFGIATLAPTAKLHVNCVPVAGQTNPSNIRFENLPTGTGNALVMDANGYVYRSSTVLSVAEVGELRKELEDLRQEIKLLKEAVSSKNADRDLTNTTGTAPILFQNVPNPFNKSTNIHYYLPESAKAALIQITDLNGRILQTISLRGSGRQSVSIDGGRLAPGTYIYTLYVEGRKADSKKMVLTE